MASGDAVKIGFSYESLKRKSQLQGGNPDKIHLLDEFVFGSSAEAVKWEQWCHKKLDSWRTDGGTEWFRPPADKLGAVIARVRQESAGFLNSNRASKAIESAVDYSFSEANRCAEEISASLRLHKSMMPTVRGIVLRTVMLALDQERKILFANYPELGAQFQKDLSELKRRSAA